MFLFIKKKRGYTLIELIVAIAVFGILIVPVTNMIVTIIDINKEANKNMDIASIMSRAYEEKIGEINSTDIINLGTTETSYGTDGKYTIRYTILKNNSSNIYGIQNDKKDINMSVDENRFIRINDIEKIELTDGKNDIFIKVVSIDNERVIYEFYNKSRDLDKISIGIRNPKFGINFNGEKIKSLSNINLNFIVDGIYDNKENLLSEKSLVFNSNLTDDLEDKIKVISGSPFVLICNEDNDNYSNNSEESVYEMIIDIIDVKSKSVLRSQRYYFTKILK